MTRTDIHRPADLDPSAYDVIDFGDNGTGEEAPAHPVQSFRELREQGFVNFEGAHRTRCTHCGAHIRYYAILVHRATKAIIFAGETCVDNRFDTGMTKAQFQTLRTNAMLNRERTAVATKRAALLEAHPFLVELAASTFDFSQDFLCSIQAQIKTKGELSDRQIQSAQKALDGFKRFQAVCAQREADKAAAIASGATKPAPTGKVVVTGTVLSTKLQESQFGSVLKMVVETTDGWKLWSSVPASIIDEVEKGDTVTMSVTVTPSDDDEFFAFGKRPTKASIVK